MSKRHLTAEQLRELFDYDSSTGLFCRRRATTNKVKSTIGIWQPGSLTKLGYNSLRVNGKAWQAHRLAWLYMHGALPDGQIDHINGVRNDNRIANLRLATVSENQLNLSAVNVKSASKLRGAHWNAKRGKYQAQFERLGKRFYLGLFDTAEQAHAAYVSARNALGVMELRN